jgi:hypothetical protein
LLIPDRVSAEAVFSDEELTAYLALEVGVRRAAAAAIETIATDEALVQKVMRTGGTSTDGAKLSDALLARARNLRTLADTEDEAEDGGIFVTEWVNGPFAEREYIAAQRESELL